MKANFVKRVCFLLLCLIQLIPCSVPAFAAEASYTGEVSGFWDSVFYDLVQQEWNFNVNLGIFQCDFTTPTIANWVAGGLSGLVGHGSVCSVSPDSLHHASGLVDTQVHHDKDGASYVVARCSHCGANFNVYGSDLQQSYDAQVEELPAQGYDSGGKLHFKLPVRSFRQDKYRVSTFSPGSDWAVSLIPGSTGVSKPLTGVHGLFDDFYAPISGDYSLACYITSNVSVDLYCSETASGVLYILGGNGFSICNSGEARPELGKYFIFSSVWGYSVGDRIISSSQYFGLNGVGSSTTVYSGFWEVVCTPVSLSGDTYNINSRPTSITGDYGIIGDNGQIIKVEGDKIVNETNNTYYNPSTGQTVPITDWSYNYEDRSYTVTTETGDTVTITYGDENVVIKEGDTTYNIYYLVDGSGSENPGTCNHQWAETGTTPAICTVPGSRTLTCSLCGETKTETIPAPGHKWVIRQTVNTQYDEEGNKTQDGYTIFECSVCGEQYKSTDGGAPPGGNTGTGSGSSGGVFSGIFGLLVDFLGFFWNTFHDFVGEGVKGFLTALMNGTSSIFGLLNPFNWGG